MATHHNFRIKNGLEVGGVLIVNSSGQLQATTISGAISATSIGVTNIVTNKVVKFNGSILDDSNITDTGSLITLGSNTTVSGTISSGDITSSNDIKAAGSLWVNYNASGNEYLNLNYASGGDGGILFRHSNALKWQHGATTNTGNNLFWYSYTASNTVMTLSNSGLLSTDSGYDVNGTTVIDSSRNLTNIGTISSGAITSTGNIVAEDSEVHVGNTSGDNWTRIKHALADGYGFDFQHDNATVIVNEQGSTNQVMVLGDVDAANYSGLFGVAHSTNSGTAWTKKLDLRGDGELYIGASGTNQVYHEGHKPTYTELGTMAYSNLTGTPTIPSLSGYATESYVGTQISNLVDSSPAALNTLNELAAAIGDDANFSTTVTNNIASKVSKSGDTITSGTNVGLTINHNTFGAGLRLHRNHASNASSIQFINNGGRQGTLLGIAADNGLYWQIGTSTTNNKIFHDTYHPNADTWTTARNLVVTLTGDVTGTATQSVNGSAGKTWSIATTVANNSHTHNNLTNYVLKAGDTMTGNITAPRFVQSGSSGNSFYGASFTRSASGTTTPDIWGANGTLVLGTSSSVESVGFSGANAQFYGTISSGAITSSDNLTIGDGTQALNGDGTLTIRKGNAFAGLDFKSARTAGNIGGPRFYNTSSTSVPAAQLLVEVDGSYNFYNGTNGAQNRLKIDSSGAATFAGTISSGAITSTVVNTGDATLLTLHHDTGVDIAQQKSFIDFSFEDDNTNETPQVRIGAEVGQNANADSQIKEGSGAFVVYTNNANTTDGAAGTSLAERMRVDYQGNVLIGKTASDFATAGAELAKDGTPGKVQFSRASNPLSLNNITNNGNIISFYKGAGAVGDIGIEGGDSLYIQAGTTSGSGLRFHPSAGTVEPVRNGITIHNTINLGSATRQFKDAYFEKVYVRQNTAQAGAVLEFSDEPSSWSQNGSITFRHLDTACYGSGAMFEIGTDQPTTTILANGKLMFEEGLYIKPSSGTGAGTLVIDETGIITSSRIRTDTATGLSITADSNNRGILNLSTSQAYQLIGGTHYGYTGYKTGGYHRWFGSDGSEDMRLDSTGLNISVGTLEMGGTTVIDANLNLTNIGTITNSGAIRQTISNVGIPTVYSSFTMEATDAQLDLISSSAGTWGSAINFVEGASTTANTNNWSIARKTSGGGNTLNFNFGTGNQHDNTTRMTFASDGAITATGNVSLNQADGFVYLNNQGVGNAGIYVRGITSTSTLRSHSTNNFRWEVTGGQKMELNSSGVLNAVGGYQVNSTTVIDASRNVITGSNFYFGATNSSLLAKDGANIRYLADGIHKFETYNGGWSERVRIDDAGLDVTSGVLSVNGGTTNVVATFQSTDSIAAIKLQDSVGNVELSASGSTFRVQPTGSTPVLEINSSGNATFTGSITVGGTVDGVDIAARNAVLTSTTTTANAALPKAGGTMSGTLTMNGNAISMGNGPITNANNLSFNDPGPSEGVKWEGGSLWQIYESPDNLTTNSGGNLQFTSGSGNGTRRMTLNTSGDLYVQGDISMAGLYTGSWAQSTSHSVGRIGQVADRVAGSITNQIGGSTSAKWEVVDYGWNTVLLNCTNAGDFTASSSVRSGGGNYYGNQAASVQYRGYGDTPILSGVNGATYLYSGGSTVVALTLQAGRTVAPILSIGQVNSYSDVITSARAVQNITSISMSGDLVMTKSQPWVVIENTTEDGGGIVFNDNQAGAWPAASSQAFRMTYHSGNNSFVMGHDENSYTGFSFASGGNFTASGNITAYSDERLKENIQTLDSKKTLQMRGVSFTKDGKESSGVIAQEIEKIAPELVQTNEQDGYKSVAYGNLVGYLIETVKDQQKQIDDLKELINNIIKSNSKEN